MTMDRYVITGKQRLEGQVGTSGAKKCISPFNRSRNISRR
jgi:UDP-N-acetylglucosamine enolpyruvyl transferase